MSKSMLETLKELTRKDPNNPLGRYGLANEYLKLGMYEQAISEISAYLKLKEDEGAAYRILGESLLKLGRKDEARDAFRRGMEVAERHGHMDMVFEFQDALESLD